MMIRRKNDRFDESKDGVTNCTHVRSRSCVFYGPKIGYGKMGFDFAFQPDLIWVVRKGMMMMCVRL